MPQSVGYGEAEILPGGVAVLRNELAPAMAAGSHSALRDFSGWGVAVVDDSGAIASHGRRSPDRFFTLRFRPRLGADRRTGLGARQAPPCGQGAATTRAPGSRPTHHGARRHLAGTDHPGSPDGARAQPLGAVTGRSGSPGA
jgi:hypothetical protein